MLDIHKQGQNVTLTFTVPNYNGSVLEFDTATWKVFDSSGTELASGNGSFDVGGSIVTVEILAAANTLDVDTNRDIRVLELIYGTTDNGEFTDRQRYIIETYSVLQPLENSFQTLDEAFLNRAIRHKALGWDAASESEKISALISAYDRLCILRYRYKDYRQAFENDVSYRWPYTYIQDIRKITQSEWEETPEEFQDALKKAQFVEADLLLGGNPVHQKRESGIVSETTGESKMFFNNRKPLQLPVYKDTLQIISGYFHFTAKLARG